MNGIIPNKNTKVIRCDAIENLEIKEIIESVPNGLYCILGTKSALAGYMRAMQNIPGEFHNSYATLSAAPHLSPKSNVKAWHIDYTLTDEEYHSMLFDLKKYINVEHFYYKCLIDNTDFLIFIGKSSISVIYTNGKILSLEDENEYLENENIELKIKLSRIPKWIRYIFKAGEQNEQPDDY